MATHNRATRPGGLTDEDKAALELAEHNAQMNVLAGRLKAHDEAEAAARKKYGRDFMEMTEHQGPQVRATPGRRYEKVMPYSEVCMHMRVAGTRMAFELSRRKAVSCGSEYWAESVQLYKPDGTPFSSGITPGEAGLYYVHDDGKLFHEPDQPPGYHYFYPDAPYG